MIANKEIIVTLAYAYNCQYSQVGIRANRESKIEFFVPSCETHVLEISNRSMKLVDQDAAAKLLSVPDTLYFFDDVYSQDCVVKLHKEASVNHKNLTCVLDNDLKFTGFIDESSDTAIFNVEPAGVNFCEVIDTRFIKTVAASILPFNDILWSVEQYRTVERLFSLIVCEVASFMTVKYSLNNTVNNYIQFFTDSEERTISVDYLTFVSQFTRKLGVLVKFNCYGLYPVHENYTLVYSLSNFLSLGDSNEQYINNLVVLGIGAFNQTFKVGVVKYNIPWGKPLVVSEALKNFLRNPSHYLIGDKRCMKMMPVLEVSSDSSDLSL